MKATLPYSFESIEAKRVREIGARLERYHHESQSALVWAVASGAIALFAAVLLLATN